jgi:KUP system potassium uptake protein
VPLVVLFLVFDLSFLGSNLLKILDGGWFTLTVAALIMTAMLTWRDGKQGLGRPFASMGLPIGLFLESLVALDKYIRIPGTAVFMSVSTTGTPLTLLHHYKHIKVLHEQVILLSITSAETPFVPDSLRLEVTSLGHGFFRIIVRYGFMQSPNVPEILRPERASGLDIELSNTTIFRGARPCSQAGRRKYLPGGKTCSPTCGATRGMPPPSSASLQGAWWSWGARSNSRISAPPVPAGGFQTSPGRICFKPAKPLWRPSCLANCFSPCTCF